MTLKLNRNKILFIGLGLVAVFLVINRVNYIISSTKTIGKIEKIKVWKNKITNEIDTSIPIVVFEANGKTYKFESESNMKLDIGDKVEVIYKTNNPSHAKIYSFIGFWMAPLIWCLLPIILIGAISYGFLEKTDVLIFTFGEKISFRKSKNEPNDIISKLVKEDRKFIEE